MKIPIKNIYYMLCYAWEAVAERDLVNLAEEEYDHYEDFLATVLSKSVEKCLKLGAERRYQERKITSNTIRGKLDLASSIKGDSLVRLQAICNVEELTEDILSNQILKWAITSLAGSKTIKSSLKRGLLKLRTKMIRISDKKISARDFYDVHIHRNNRYYAFPLNIAKLVFDSQALKSKEGQVKFYDFFSEERLWNIYQQFVFNFFSYELEKGYSVSAKKLRWFQASGNI